MQSTISALTIFPVKSLQGVSLEQAEVTPYGLKWDRFWMIVNEDGRFVTQRQMPNMATIRTRITETHLILSHPSCADLLVPLAMASLQQREGKVWRDDCLVIDEGASASQWLTAVLGQWKKQNLSLVRMAPEFDREVSSADTEEQHHTYFADGFPFLVVSTASLETLNHSLKQQNENAIPMSRFRVNIEVDNVEAFSEHKHPYLLIPQDQYSIKLHLCKPCERCKVTTIDQLTGHIAAPQQPIKTLLNMDHVDRPGAFFGHNAVLSGSLPSDWQNPVIRLGDAVCFSDE